MIWWKILKCESAQLQMRGHCNVNKLSTMHFTTLSFMWLSYTLVKHAFNRFLHIIQNVVSTVQITSQSLTPSTMILTVIVEQVHHSASGLCFSLQLSSCPDYLEWANFWMICEAKLNWLHWEKDKHVNKMLNKVLKRVECLIKNQLN